MSKTISELLEEVGDVRANPAGIQRVIINAVSDMTDGEYEILDATNPVTFLLEAGSVVGSASILRNEVLSRRQYSSLSQDESDLYYHMSDEDYIDIFATPARTSITFLLSLDEVIEKAIDDGSGVKKMVIPKDTEIVVEDMTFTMQYPIEIRVMPHGGVQIVYDVEKVNPLYTLSSNVLDWSAIKMSTAVTELSGITMLKFDVPINQFKIEDYYDQLSTSSGFNKSYAFSDDFYYCRVYISDGDDEWKEITTTHSEKVYDPTDPTAVLKVVGKTVSVNIPQIYFTDNSISRGVRIDIYTTKGPLNTMLERYQPNNFTANWRDLAKYENEYISPIKSFSTIIVYSTSSVSGGRKQLDFESLRSRVIHNALGNVAIPITSVQLEAEMDTLGYTIIKEIDNITNRLYLASREIPKSDVDISSAGVGSTIATLESSMNNLKTIQTVKDNNARMTIESGTLFYIDDGILRLVDNLTLDHIAAADTSVKVQYLSNTSYIYTPFHYVLDTNDNKFESRAYFLDKPNVESKQFISENETTMLSISTAEFAIEKSLTGYSITVKTRSGKSIKTLADELIHSQISFIPIGEVSRVYLNGVLLGKDSDGEYIFKFSLDCTFDIDSDHSLQLDTFQMYESVVDTFGISLSNVMDITYSVSGYTMPNIEYSSIDLVLGGFLLPVDAIGVMHEQLNIEFGNSLDGLWNKSRTIVGAADYERWAADEPAVYSNIVYVRDPITSTIEMVYNSVTNTVDYTILHNAGDPVLDGSGNPTFEHLAGDVKLGPDGNPILTSNRSILRQVDLMLLEGVFLFATETVVVNYISDVINTLVDWITNDIKAISERLLENTHMWYYPSKTLGDVEAYIEGGVSTLIASEQIINIKFYMTNSTYNDLILREDLSNTAIGILSQALANQTISMVDIATKIKVELGDDVIDVSLSGLGGENNYDVVTLYRDSSRLNIHKLPVVLPDGRITVQDNVSIEFINHTGAYM